MMSCQLQENQENQNNLTITNTNSKQAVYVYKCNKSTLKISGKVNSIVLGMFPTVRECGVCVRGGGVDLSGSSYLI